MTTGGEQLGRGAAVEATGISKRFGADDTVLRVLDNVSLHVTAGEVVTVLGPSGSGKTTLLRLIAGLEGSFNGTITIDGESSHEARSRKRIAFMPQSPALLPWRTVRANARLLLDVGGPNPATAADPDALLAEVGLVGFEQYLPHQLSGGMQQRVALVRAFALGSPLLLMDEPFAALDELVRTDMRHLLARLCERTGSTVVFVTHSISEAVFLSDRVVVLSARPGRVVGERAIDLVRPRTADMEDRPEFFAHTVALRHLLGQGATA